jgi:DNA helicase-2/ATP-dependent DNA helicase PcrA
MTSRIESPDTTADIKLRALLDQDNLSGFVVTAGAGSGKTTSLVKALVHLVEVHGDELRARTQRVACITYTEVAAGEIHAEVGMDPLVAVSTIHSFLWDIAKPFQRDIAAWTKHRLEAKIAEVEEKQATYGSGTKSSTKEKNSADLEKLHNQLAQLPSVTRFTYEFGSDYGRGILGHEDILNLAPDLINQKPLLASIMARKFPYVFVDESQDTFTNVVACLKHVRSQESGRVSLGFFGDPMQQIFQRSTGVIELEDGWVTIEKPENFRSSKRVLEVVNKVRSVADGLQQLPGGSPKNDLEGEAFFFVLPADDDRSQHLERVRTWLNANSVAGSWTADDPEAGAKILMIVHRMAAKRMGFEKLFAAFSDNGSHSLKEAFEEGSAWPVRPFTDVIIPITSAHDVDAVSVIATLRQHSSILASDLPAGQIRGNLKAARVAALKLREVFVAGGAGSVGEALKCAVQTGLTAPDPRLDFYFDQNGKHANVVLSDTALATMDAFCLCDVRELDGYVRYINNDSPYSTQHGTKGAEFRKVIVVLDDDEGKYNLYSYDKLLGIKPLSDTDKQNQSKGIDSAIDRTRRLLYVCVSRAIESLAVVMFAKDVDVARSALHQSGLCGDAEVMTLPDLVSDTTHCEF